MVRPSLALLLLAACRRDPPAPPPPPRPVVPAVAPAPRPPAVDPACPWTWSDATDLTVDGPRPGLPAEWDAACTDAELVVARRVGTRLTVARRRLDPAARWSEPAPVAEDVLRLGKSAAVEGRPWLTWVNTRHALCAARLEPSPHLPDPALPAPDGTFATPAILGGTADAAVILTRFHRHGADHLVLVRVGFDQPAVGGLLAQGEVLTARAGEAPAALVLARETTPAGPLNALRLHRIDVRAALAMTGVPGPLRLGALPPATARVGEALPVGRGRFEVSPLAPLADAVLLQTAVGAERGTVRVAWFPAAGRPSSVTLPFAAQALGSAVADGPPAVSITWWDEHHVPRRARVTPEGMGEATVTGPAEASARDAQQRASDTRTVWCGAVPWVLEARPAPDGVRVRARRWPCPG